MLFKGGKDALFLKPHKEILTPKENTTHYLVGVQASRQQVIVNRFFLARHRNEKHPRD